MMNNRLDNLLKMLETNPDDPFLIYAAGIEYESIGDNKNAEKYFDMLLIQFPDYLPVYYQAGMFYLKQDHTAKAIELFQKGITLAVAQKNFKTKGELETALWEIED